MPFIPILTAIAAVAGLGATGYSLYESTQNNPTEQAQNAAKIEQQAAAQQAAQQRTQSVLANQGNAQQATGGSLTDAGTASFINTLAGYGGSGGNAGTGTGTSAAAVSNPFAATLDTLGAPGGAASGTNFADILRQLTQAQGGASSPGNISGGYQSQQSPAGDLRFELATPLAQ